MKEERLAVLSMVEKGIINVDEAERLLRALSETAQSEENKDSVISKAGENFGSFIKNAAEKTEKFIVDTNPVVKNVAMNARPKIKELSEKASIFTNKIIKRKKDSENNDVTDDDFEKDVTIMPVSHEQTDVEETDKEHDENKNEKE